MTAGSAVAVHDRAVPKTSRARIGQDFKGCRLEPVTLASHFSGHLNPGPPSATPIVALSDPNYKAAGTAGGYLLLEYSIAGKKINVNVDRYDIAGRPIPVMESYGCVNHEP
jgi:hypothetical protein